MVKWLRQTAHDQEVMGSNPGTIYWMDVSNITHKKIAKKDSRMKHTKKKN
jgi:hypothetical protein